jgi:integrase
MRTMLKAMSIEDIAEQICEHFIDRKDKKKCEACRRAIYRAKERLDRDERADKTYAPIDDFENIPEIKQLLEYSEANNIRPRSKRGMILRLKRMWNWIRENPEFENSQRPVMWEEKHIVYILKKVSELNIARYMWIQSLRRFFEANNKSNMLQYQLLRARAKDLRTPKGQRRTIDRFTLDELRQILSVCTSDEAFYIQLHITLKSREGCKGEGSLLNLKWDNVNWNDRFYGFDAVTITVFEPKTGGGIYWEHCLVDLWWGDLSAKLKERYARKTNDYIIPYTKAQYSQLWNRISQKLGKDFEPHDCRRSPAGWLRDLGLSDLAIGQVDMASGRGAGFAGVGWENPKIFYDRYGKMNPVAIFDKKQRPNTTMFTGLICKILEQKQ